MTSERKTRSDSSPRRPRFLNVIYFVDSSKTNTLKFRLTRLRFLIGLLVGIFVVSLGHTILLYRVIDREAHVLQELRTAKALIFDYQTQVDGVFENAYKEETQTKASLNQSVVASPPQEETVVEETAADDEEMVVATEQEHGNAKSTVEALIEVPRVELSEQKIILKFGIRNTKSPLRIDGKVWARLVLKDSQGKTHYAIYPPILPVDDRGVALNPLEYASPFSIRHYKAEEFVFEMPAQNEVVLLESFDIFMLDKSGRKSSFQILIQAPPSQLENLILSKNYSPFEKEKSKQ